MLFENVLAVIPARRGSKRFPHKNTALFQGVPLVQNTIRIAKEAGIDKIIVTTDDVDVMQIAAAEDVVCVRRTPDLCTDDARGESVVENAVHYATGAVDGPMWDSVNTICLLQVTSPLLRWTTLTRALHEYDTTNAQSLVAINPNTCKPAGAFYIVDLKKFMWNKSFYQDVGGVYELTRPEWLDVDYAYDLSIAAAYASGRVI